MLHEYSWWLRNNWYYTRTYLMIVSRGSSTNYSRHGYNSTASGGAASVPTTRDSATGDGSHAAKPCSTRNGHVLPSRHSWCTPRSRIDGKCRFNHTQARHRNTQAHIHISDTHTSIILSPGSPVGWVWEREASDCMCMRQSCRSWWWDLLWIPGCILLVSLEPRPLLFP